MNQRPGVEVVGLLGLSGGASCCSCVVTLTAANPKICSMDVLGSCGKSLKISSALKFRSIWKKNRSTSPLESVKPNIEEYRSVATVCRKVRKRATKRTDIWNNPVINRLPSENLPMTRAECEEMIKHKICSAGSMTQVGETLKTTNSLDLTTSYWTLSDTAVSVDNCYLYKSTVSTYFGKHKLVSGTGDMEHCDYQKGRCQLADLTFMIGSQ
uniref:Uncharacterized protein n=1 Tax=Ditylenchus dipsaci TaxID=166011 RepID=A0A915DVH6_9BILA